MSVRRAMPGGFVTRQPPNVPPTSTAPSPLAHPAHETPADREGLAFALLVTALFAGLVGTTLAHHEMWRDELTSWMIALDSSGLRDLLYNLEYEGHPPAWYLLLMGVGRLTADPAALQAVAGLMAVATAFLVTRFAPFSRPVRVLVVFSYFVAYEYAVIARSYGLGMLCVVAACVLAAQRRRSPFLLAIVLSVLALTSIYGVILACAIALGVVVDRSLAPGRPALAVTFAALAVFVLAVITSLVSIPPPDPVYTGRPVVGSGVSAQWALARTLAVPWGAYVPLPPVEDGFIRWGPTLIPLDYAWQLSTVALLSLLLIGVFALGMTRRPAALLLYLSGTGVFLFFVLFGYRGGPRHNGHLFLLLVAALWLARSGTPEFRLSGAFDRVARWGERFAPAVFVGVLVTQVVSSALLHFEDLKRPFAGGGAIAERILEVRVADEPVAVTSRSHVSTLAAYLREPVNQLLGPGPETWADSRVGPRLVSTQDALLEPLLPLVDRKTESALVVTLEPLRDTGVWEVEELARVMDAIVHHERLLLYRVRPRSRATGSSTPMMEEGA